MRSPRPTAALAALALCLGACSVMNGAAETSLDSTDWTLAALDGTRAVTPAPDRVTLRFEDGRAAGSDGCNRYSSPYESGNGRLAFGAPRVGTQMACPEPETKFAEAFHRVLDATRAHRLQGGELLLIGADGRTLARLRAQAVALAGTSWLVTGVNNGRQGVVSVLQGTTLTMDFDADGRLAGSAGCNRYTAAYQADGPGLKIGAAATTRMNCDQPVGRMEQEQAFLAALQTVSTQRREGDRLELRSASGALAVSAQAAQSTPNR